MKPISPYEERQRLRSDARDAFLRAAAALTEAPTTEVLAFALLEGALGLHAIAQLDKDDKARARVEERLHAALGARP